MVIRYSKYLILISLLALSGLPAQSGSVLDDDLAGENIIKREAAQAARASGFADLEVDNLHGAISKKMVRILSYGHIQQTTALGRKGLRERDHDAHIRLKSGDEILYSADKSKNKYIRFRIREGTSYSVQTFPIQYIFKAHCFLILSPDQKSISKVIFQFYRINFSGIEYSREIRRMTHPEPKDVAKGNILAKDLKLLNNSNILLEQYEEPYVIKPKWPGEKRTIVQPKWEGRDGIPLPVLGIKPKETVLLNNPKDLIPYDKQVRIINRYKSLLRKIDRRLDRIILDRELERKIRIERILDFPG